MSAKTERPDLETCEEYGIEPVPSLARYALALENRLRRIESSPDLPGLSALADIREALGVGDGPMLDELAGIVRGVKRDRNFYRDENNSMYGMMALMGWNEDVGHGEFADTLLRRLQALERVAERTKTLELAREHADACLIQALRTTLHHHETCHKERDGQSDCSCWRSEAYLALDRMKKRASDGMGREKS